MERTYSSSSSEPENEESTSPSVEERELTHRKKGRGGKEEIEVGQKKQIKTKRLTAHIFIYQIIK